MLPRRLPTVPAMRKPLHMEKLFQPADCSRPHLPIPGATLPGSPNATYDCSIRRRRRARIRDTRGKPTYQITPFLSDYYDPASGNTGGLNSSSNLVKAVGYGSTSGCLTYTFGISGTGSGSGFGNTYFASSIYEAQAALTAEQTARPGSKNAIIFLSDGQANASYYTENSERLRNGELSTNQFYGRIRVSVGPCLPADRSLTAAKLDRTFE